MNIRLQQWVQFPHLTFVIMGALLDLRRAPPAPAHWSTSILSIARPLAPGLRVTHGRPERDLTRPYPQISPGKSPTSRPHANIPDPI